MSDEDKKNTDEKSSDAQNKHKLTADKKKRADEISQLKGLANIKTENFDSNEVARDLANSITDKIYHHYLPENEYFDNKKKKLKSIKDINLKNELRVGKITDKTIEKYEDELAKKLSSDLVEQTIKEIDEQYEAGTFWEGWFDGAVKKIRWLGIGAIPAVYVVLLCLLALIATDSYKLANISINTTMMAFGDDNRIDQFLNEYEAAACDMESSEMLAKLNLDTIENALRYNEAKQGPERIGTALKTPNTDISSSDLISRLSGEQAPIDNSQPDLTSRLSDEQQKIGDLAGSHKRIVNTSRFALCMNAILLVEEQEFNIIRDKMNRAVSLTLSVLDLLLILSLTVMVTVGMYENTVSRIGVNHGYPTWFGKLDIGELKIKVAASIVIISSIHLLMMFMQINLTKEAAAEIDFNAVMWTTIVHLVFVLSAIILAGMEYIAVKTKKL